MLLPAAALGHDSTQERRAGAQGVRGGWFCPGPGPAAVSQLLLPPGAVETLGAISLGGRAAEGRG